MSQLNLFTGKTCVHCGENPGTKPGNPSLWDGFLDKDTGALVCTGCRDEHYIRKAQAMDALETRVVKNKRLRKQITHYTFTRMTYSEFPVML